MKKNIAIIFGGYSGEYKISVQSADVVAKYLQKTNYNVYKVLISNEGWYLIGENGQKFAVDKTDFSIKNNEITIQFDAVFIAIHGTPGEDGKLQGYFDMINLPYTSCNHASSAITFNKYFCKQIVKSIGIQTAESVIVYTDDKNNPDRISGLNYPLFIKPNNGGSSVGMSKISDRSQVENAIELAFREDDEIIVEEFVKGREITCAVMKYNKEIIVFPITEIISKKDFFDYEAKYDPSLAEEIVPARIPEDIAEKCRQTSVKLYNELNCSGVIRCDYIFNEDGLYFLEINTIPGMTESSILPKMAKAYGFTPEKLFKMLVEEALS
ncbi:MAG: D-alanine--D-alanine ligase [Bacteroidales bacterium]|nr:D-alanine--D-alanine ligase [Bacteroidales bacterium]